MKKLIILIIFIASIKLFAQNNWESKDIYSSNVKVSSPNTCFINANTGYTVLNFESNCD